MEVDTVDSRKYYNEKYDTGDYRGLYGGLDKNDVGVLPIHYLLSALYIRYGLLVDTDSKVLEIGCGVGAFLYEMKRIGYDNIAGIDISDKAKELAIMPDIINQGDAAKLKVQDNAFDLLVSIGTYEHINIEDLDTSLKEIVRVSKKAVLWIDRDETNSDHNFNENESWWADRIADITNAKTIYVDERMIGGAGTHPILVNFEFDKILKNFDLVKSASEEVKIRRQ